jgi:hypothetical protein
MKCTDLHLISLLFAVTIKILILIGSSVVTKHEFQANVLGTVVYVSLSPPPPPKTAPNRAGAGRKPSVGQQGFISLSSIQLRG